MLRGMAAVATIVATTGGRRCYFGNPALLPWAAGVATLGGRPCCYGRPVLLLWQARFAANHFWWWCYRGWTKMLSAAVEDAAVGAPLCVARRRRHATSVVERQLKNGGPDRCDFAEEEREEDDRLQRTTVVLPARWWAKRRSSAGLPAVATNRSSAGDYLSDGARWSTAGDTSGWERMGNSFSPCAF
jgi:hypothetical protein